MSRKAKRRRNGISKKRNSKKQISKIICKALRKIWKRTRKHVKKAARNRWKVSWSLVMDAATRFLARKSITAFFDWLMMLLTYVFGLLRAPEMVEVAITMGLLVVFSGIYLIDKAMTLFRRIVRSIEKK